MKLKHFFVKCPAMWKNWAWYTQNANTRSQFWVLVQFLYRCFFFFFFFPEGIVALPVECVNSFSTLSQCSWHWFSDNTFGVKLDLVCHVIYPIASTLYLPNSPWFLQKYVKLDQKSWKSTQTSRRVNPMAASFHALYLLPQLNSARSSRHNIFCRVERAK